jgi:excisionase family DNA binding protein
MRTAGAKIARLVPAAARSDEARAADLAELPGTATTVPVLTAKELLMVDTIAERVAERLRREAYGPRCMPHEAPLSIQQIADRVGRDHQAVRRAIRRGELRAYKITGRITIFEVDLDTWLQRCAVRPSHGSPSRGQAGAGLARRANAGGLKRLLDGGPHDA